jgi:2-polyprenyl-6-methoxyphenol hydroxylase-like FAD-dependent oxidoreductase
VAKGVSVTAGSAVVVGGGPAGVLLTYLLARGGVPVTLLESRGDFNRRFRGDTLAPPVLDYLDTLGLAEPLLAAVPHAERTRFAGTPPPVPTPWPTTAAPAAATATTR